MFMNCGLLSKLTDISKWDVSKCEDIDLMFYGCLSLVSFPDIWKWNTANVIEGINEMFGNCISLPNFPEYEKISGNNMFKNCINLVVKKPLLIECENEDEDGD